MVLGFSVGLKALLHWGLSGPEFYGDLEYIFKKIMGRTDFSDQFRKIIIRQKRIGYDFNVMQQSACLVINPITVDNFVAALFYQTDLKLFILAGLDQSSFVCCLVHRGSTDDLRLWCCLADQGSPFVTQHVVYVESSSLLLHSIKT